MTAFERLHELLRESAVEHWVGTKESGGKIILLAETAYGGQWMDASYFDCIELVHHHYAIGNKGYTAFFHVFTFDPEGVLVASDTWE